MNGNGNGNGAVSKIVVAVVVLGISGGGVMLWSQFQTYAALQQVNGERIRALEIQMAEASRRLDLMVVCEPGLQRKE